MLTETKDGPLPGKKDGRGTAEAGRVVGEGARESILPEGGGRRVAHLRSRGRMTTTLASPPPPPPSPPPPLRSLARRRWWEELERRCAEEVAEAEAEGKGLSEEKEGGADRGDGGEEEDEGCCRGGGGRDDDCNIYNDDDDDDAIFVVPPTIAPLHAFAVGSVFERLRECVASGPRETCSGGGGCGGGRRRADADRLRRRRALLLAESCADALLESLPRDPPASAVTSLLRLRASLVGGGNGPTTDDPLLLRRLRVSRSVPLHVACYSGCGPGVVRALVDACPKSVLLRNKAGWTPLALMCWSIRQSRRRGTMNDSEIAGGTVMSDESLCDIARTLLLVDGSNSNDDDNDDQNETKGQHAVAAVPPSLRRKARAVIVAGDAIGWTPLHVACWAGAPASLVRLLLDERPPPSPPSRFASSYSSKRKRRERALPAAPRAREGWTPLHVACRYSAGPSVVRMLARAHPSSVSSMAGDGWTPLTLALHWGADSGTVRELLRSDPSTASARVCWMGMSPLDVLWYFGRERDDHLSAEAAEWAAGATMPPRRHRGRRLLRGLLLPTEDDDGPVETTEDEEFVVSTVHPSTLPALAASSATNKHDDGYDDDDDDDFLIKLSLLLVALRRHRVPSAPDPPGSALPALRAAVAVLNLPASTFPERRAREYAARKFAAAVSKENAAAFVPADDDDNDEDFDDDDVDDDNNEHLKDDTMVDDCRAGSCVGGHRCLNPPSCQRRTLRPRCRLLHRALREGLVWCGDLDGDGQTWDSDVGGLLERVFRAYPGAVRERDRATGLFPFMLAAAAGRDCNGYDDEESSCDGDRGDSLARLDTVYQLLRRAPETVVAGPFLP